MSAQKDFINILSSTLVIVLAFIIIFASNTFLETSSLIETRADESLTEDLQLISNAEVLNAGIINEENIRARTDPTKKILQFVPGTSQALRDELLNSVNAEVSNTLDANTIVINIPEDNIEEVEQNLFDSSLVNNFETDHAVGLLARADWGVVRIGADRVWESTTGSGIRISILDTGVDGTHPELSGRIVSQYDFYNNDAFAQDDHGHGTVVAGIAAAARNASGTIGVGPDILIMAGKVLGEDGYGYLSDVVDGVNWSVENGAQIINMSLGTTYDSKILKNAVDRASANGVILVAAAGNTGGQMTYPAAYDSVIAVGATDSNDRLASFSARGSELVAPGVNITAPTAGGGYTTVSGTSASSPHVAGVAAKMIASQITNIRDTLRRTAIDLGEEGRDHYFGYGLVYSPTALGLEEGLDEFEAEDLEGEMVLEVRILRPAEGSVLIGRNHPVITMGSENVVRMRLFVNGSLIHSADGNSLNWLWPVVNYDPGNYLVRIEGENDDGEAVFDQVSVVIDKLANEEVSVPDSAEIIDRVQRGGQGESLPVPAENVGRPFMNESVDGRSGANSIQAGQDNAGRGGPPDGLGRGAQSDNDVQGASTESPAFIMYYLIRILLGF